MYKPNYRITDELLNKIAEIEKIRSTIDSSYILPEREIELRHRATVEATHSSTSIEGNPLNARQVEKVLSSKNPLTRHKYAEIEVRNYKKALDFIDKRISGDSKISAKDILEIHKIAMKGLIDEESKIGAWRPKSVYIENEKEEIVYTAVKRADLESEIDAFLSWLNDVSYDIHPVIAAAILHFHFVSIHPFSDGNGRTTRLLTTLYLGLRDYDLRGSLVLDTYYSMNKKEYYNALDLADSYDGRKNAEIDSWVNYFTDGFLVSANVLATEILLLSSVIRPDSTDRISKDNADLLSYAKQFGAITLSEAEDVLPNVPRRTLQRKLKQLVDDEYLTVEGSARDTRYRWK